ncbi:MAG: hypothetical protein EON54_16790 [Alcaligenaceae bacterium]|nr:MAG: hypothetical protein EON54_16790 [Alcaligenaceae bacterium]
MLLMVVVAVVVTVFTAGVMAPAAMCYAGGAASFGATMAAGASALTAGGLTMGTVIAGAAGAVAGQLVGMATGNVEKFSWEQVALSAVSAGGSGGLAGADLSLGQLGDVMARAAIGNVITQGLGVATGLQRSFDWRGVAASAVGAGVGNELAPAMGDAFGTSAVGQFGARVATSLLAGTAAAAMRGGKVAVQQVAVDAFGNALGSSLAEASIKVDQTMLPTGNFSRMDRASDPYAMAYQAADGAVISDAEQLARVRAYGRLVAIAGSESLAGIQVSELGRSVELSPASVPGLADGFFDADGEGWLVPINVRASRESQMIDAQQEFRRNEIEAANTIPSWGEMREIRPSSWESLWGSEHVQYAVGKTITGTVVASVANFIGMAVSAVRTDGYNFANFKHVHGVEKQRALQDTAIGIAMLPLGGGSATLARAELVVTREISKVGIDHAARVKAIREVFTDASGRLLSLAERRGIKFTVRAVESEGYRLGGSIKYKGNQGVDLWFNGVGNKTGRFGLAEAKASSSLASLERDTLGIRQGSFEFFNTRLQRGGRLDLQRELQSGNTDLFGGFSGRFVNGGFPDGKLYQFDPLLFATDVNFRTTPGAAIRLR